MGEVHTLTLTRYTQRYLRGTQADSAQDNVIEGNQRDILNAVNNKSLSIRGWEVTENPVGFGDESGITGKTWSRFDVDLDEETKDEKGMPLGRNTKHRFEMYLKVTYSKDTPDTDSQQFPRLCQSVYTKAKQHVLGDWYLTAVDSKPYVVSDDPALSVGGEDSMEYAPLEMPEDWETPFQDLFGLESQIEMIQSRLFAAVDSEWEHRFNCALIGPPGCGKSHIAKIIKGMLGEDAVLEFDATATTGAGAIKELAEREILPRVIIIEEIEKCDQKGLNWLLAALDIRGEIRKTTARATIQRDTKVFAIATVNNKKLFESLCAGALASRFSLPIHFHRPDRSVLRQILEREIAKVNGDEAWIDPALNYCESARNSDGTIGITDPRQVIAVCLAGRDMLLTGKYQAMLEACSPTLAEAETIYSEATYEEDVVNWTGAGFAARPSTDEDA